MRVRFTPMLAVAGLLLLTGTAEASDQVSPTVGIDIDGTAVSSRGTVTYYCGTFFSQCSVDVHHDLGDIGGGSSIGFGAIYYVSSGSTVKVYDDTQELPGNAGHCYQASVSGVGSEGSDQRVSSGSPCIPYSPPKPPPEPTECGEFEPWPCGQNSPIILDLGNDGYRLTSPADGVRFDLRNQGRTVQTAWTRTGARNAFLALDRNGNRLIDNGSELFGDSTPLRSGQRASNGFEALSELDENRDGVVDANDVQWSEVLLWTDRDHNGVSTSDELEPIAGSAVTAIETDYKVAGRRDRWGNQFRYRSAFHYGSTPSIRTCYDVVFRVTE